MKHLLFCTEEQNEQASHQVSHVVHAQLVGVKPHGGLQVVRGDEHQVLLPQFPAAHVLHLNTTMYRKSARGQMLLLHMDVVYLFIHRIAYLILVHLPMCLLPQVPVDVQPSVQLGCCSDTEEDEQQAPQH